MVDAIWLETQRQLRATVSERDFDTWIRPLRATAWESGELTLEVPSGFYRDWLKRDYLADLERAVTHASGLAATVRLVVNRTLAHAAPRHAPALRATPPSVEPPVAACVDSPTPPQPAATADASKPTIHLILVPAATLPRRYP